MRSVVFLALFAPQAVLGQKLDARLECKYAGADFVYDCIIRMKRHGEPLAGLEIRLSADMPSMPMAHQVKPVKAQPTKTPGEYRARLDLEMTGEWAVKLRLAGPVRDQLVLHYEFDKRGARPVKAPGRLPRK
jgi:hypothetical protein